MTVYKINFYDRDNIEGSGIYRSGNTKNLFENYINSYYSTGDKVLEAEEITEEKLLNLVNSGKIAVFPVNKNTDTFLLCNHNKMNIKPYLMKNKLFEAFKKDYINKYVEAENLVNAEIKQNELF